MTIYDFTVQKPDGSTTRLAEYKGKVVAIVNTASNCGYTKQLLGLERDYEKYKGQGYEVLAFPANQFHNQEPDDIDTIVKNYRDKYGVTFPIFNKVLVNGAEESPLFAFLKQQQGYDATQKPPLMMVPMYKKENGDYKSSPDIKWNFTKFLIDRHGEVRYRFEPEKTPSHMDAAIEELLAEA